MNRIAAVAGHQHQTIDKQIEELRERLSSVPALQMLANLSFQHLAGDPDSYREYETEPAVFVEYPTWLYLTMGGPRVPEGDFIDGRVSTPIHQLAESVIYGTMWEILSEEGIEGNGPSALAHLRMQTRLKEVVQRGAGYRVHVVAQLRELFGSLDRPIREVLGFGVEEAIRMVEGTGAVVQQALRGRQAAFADEGRRLRSALDGKDDVALAPGEERLLLALAQLPSRDRLERLQAVVGAAFFTHLHEAYLVTPDALAEATGTDEPTARAFLDAFSLEFGSLSAAGTLRPAANAAQLRAPLIRVGDGRYFAHLLAHMWWALRPRFEFALGTNPALKHRYERVRSRYLEQSATRAIARCSAHSRSGSALKYTFDDDGQGDREYELDGLVLIDSAVFLIEAKSGAMSAAARRGAPSLVEDLRTLVGEAHAQAARAGRYIRSTREAKFRTHGTELVVRAADLIDVFLVTASVEPLDAFVTRLADAAELGVVPTNDRPWPVFDLDLRVITEVVEGAGQLVHYLRRRQAVERAEMTANDELDWFGAYLADGLRTPGHRQMLLTHTTDLDSYFMGLAGERSPVARPKAMVPEPLRELVGRLESSGVPGFVEAVTALLDLGTKQQQAFSVAVSRARHRGSGDATAASRTCAITYRVAHAGPVKHLFDTATVGRSGNRVIAIAEALAPPAVALLIG